MWIPERKALGGAVMLSQSSISLMATKSGLELLTGIAPPVANSHSLLKLDVTVKNLPRIAGAMR
jgi:hypothetical protein